MTSVAVPGQTRIPTSKRYNQIGGHPEAGSVGIPHSNMTLLATYPSTQTRKSLSPSQAASLYQTILLSLQNTLSLPPKNREVPASTKFIASYARDAAQQALNSLIWDTEVTLSSNERLIQQRTIQLAESIAGSTSLVKEGWGIDVQILLSLAVAFARSHTKRLRSIAQEAVKCNPQLIQAVRDELVSSFTLLLSPNPSSSSGGLYAVRKTAHSLLCFLRISPPEVVKLFAYNKPFVLALAKMYDTGLAAIASVYGGLNVLRSAIPESPATTREPDDWERIWVSTKVALVDAFHTILRCIFDDLAASSGNQLGVASEQAFGIMFSLLELQSSSTSQQNVPRTPFLNLSLLGDYQRTYDLCHTLSTSLRHAAEKDPRLDLLESSLRSLEAQELDDDSGATSHSGRPKSAGALKLLLRSSGPVLWRTDHRVTTQTASNSDGLPSSNRVIDKGKGKAPPVEDVADNMVPDVDLKISQVLDIFPTHSPLYIGQLLALPAYTGSAEKVIEALLECTAPGEDELAPINPSSEASRMPTVTPEDDEITKIVRERRNIFDDEALDISRIQIGKKSEDSQALFKDRAYIEQMKASILRRAEAIDIEEADDEEEFDAYSTSINVASGKSGKGKAVTEPNDDPDLDNLTHVRVIGDGESEDDGDDDDDNQEEEKPILPETILELAYMRDPKLFDRDAATRRSKSRAELKAQTGWGDEQIEGWRIMLERNPKLKDKMLQKHEFSGNQNRLQPTANENKGANNGSNRGRGQGRGSRGRGRGGGRGGGGRGGEGNSNAGGGADSARERAWKDKHKASRANHNRKRGHDHKMAKAGAGPST
ncbi:hypothetical protein AMATHDRAFT_75327 [Amanita thiersii Skay4041]|uniref:CUE domain-containing protein n=1 Tax=Amanita thiersii Skay4041 TaxID=703135 RepID=A0A2A9NSV3_9AGAR|nr:hypothetical protein AMATHDRAFT_75327 [Amanita thiersii Skay4041]